MNIPPFLEKLLLSNEAVFKNASLGLSGMNMVSVPAGKTAVILEVSIEPFVNNYSTAFIETFTNGQFIFSDSNFREFARRMMFQLQIINDSYSTHFSFHNEFTVDRDRTQNDDNIVCNLKFSGFREELFIYTDRNLYFNLLYPYIEIEGIITPGLIYSYSTPSAIFTPLIQNLPNKPYAFPGSTNLQIPNQITNNTVDAYQPVNKQFYPAVLMNPATDYFKLLAEDTLFPNALQSVVFWKGSDDGMDNHAEFFSLPLINVKYALLNKRPEDYGITRPGT